MTNMTKKEEFIEALAEYLVGNQAEMSVRLQVGLQDAKAWAKLRDKTPLFGYPTKEEAVKELTDFLGR